MEGDPWKAKDLPERYVMRVGDVVFNNLLNGGLQAEW
jgi:hypothetical protein